jgi:hypothetical protein
VSLGPQLEARDGRGKPAQPLPDVCLGPLVAERLAALPRLRRAPLSEGITSHGSGDPIQALRTLSRGPTSPPAIFEQPN